MRPLDPLGAGWKAVVLLAAFASAALAAERPPAWMPTTYQAADSLVLTPATPERLASFGAWARQAPLEELVYVLRRPPRELGDLERPIVESALQRAPAERGSLRDALALRLAALPEPPRGKKKQKGAPPPPPPEAAPSPWLASIYRVALALPTRPADAEDSDAIGAGFVAGLGSRRVAGRPPVDCVRVSTHAETPEDFAAAVDSAAGFAGAICGGMTPATAMLAAAAARWRAIPVVCMAPGELQVARMSPRSWGIGPSGAQRGRALAAVIKPEKKDRVALIVSSSADTSFVSGFVSACRARGASVIGRVVYASGNASFSSEIRGLIGQRASILFWDGDPPEAAALLRQLTRERVSLRICGGYGFAPERHHRETRVFLEGVTYAGEDWALTADERARLDASLGAAGAGPSDDRHVRGYLSGRLIGAAIATGALTREELGVALGRLAADPTEGAGSLDVRAQGGALPVFSIQAGDPRRVQ